MPLLAWIPGHHPTAMTLVALGIIAVAVALLLLCHRLQRRFDAEVKDFHGNPGSDPTGLLGIGLYLLLAFSLSLLVVGLALLTAFCRR